MTKIRNLEQIEWGRIYYLRKTPGNISGFNVYFSFEDQWDDECDLTQASLDDETLSGKNNYNFVSVKSARENNWPNDDDYYSIDKTYRDKENIGYPDQNEGVDSAVWIKQNIPEEYQLVLANCGKSNISASYNAVTSRDYLKMIIEERGALYKLDDINMIKKLESYGLFDSLERWEDSWKTEKG